METKEPRVILAELRNAMTPLVLLPGECRPSELWYEVGAEAVLDAEASVPRVQDLCQKLESALKERGL
jgi:hypothetical protein